MIILDVLTYTWYSILTNVNFWVSAGIVIGGYWFLRSREYKPKANISLEVNSIKTGEGYKYLQVVVLIENTGSLLIETQDDIGNCIVIEDLKPYRDSADQFIWQDNDKELDLDVLHRSKIPSEIKVEPGEVAKIPFDFIIGEEVDNIKVYAFIENVRFHAWYAAIYKETNKIGWSATKVYEQR